MSRRFVFALLPILALAAATAAVAQDKKTRNKNKTPTGDVMTGEILPGMEHVDRIMLKTLADNKLPGASLAIAKNGRLVLVRGYGYADVEARKQVEPTSLFGLASSSKVITGAAILKLADEGKIKLDDKLIVLVPQLKTATSDPRLADVTIRHLLHHRSGVSHHAGAGDPHKASRPLPYFQKCLAAPLEFDPGTKGSYSNLGFALLGFVVHKVARQTEESYMKTHVLQTMGITRMRQRTTMPMDDEVSYYRDGIHKVRFNPAPAGFDTEWRASAADVVRFLVCVNGSRGEAPFVSESLMKDWHANPDKWGKQGSLPANNSLMVHHKDSSGTLDWAIILNAGHRGHKHAEESEETPPAYKELHRAIKETTNWPDGDLFDKYYANR